MRIMGLMFIRTGWYLVLGVVFGVLSFMRTNAFKQRTGTSPWHIHPVVWGIASVFVAIFGTLLSIIACSTSSGRSRRRVTTDARCQAPTEYTAAPDFGLMNRSAAAPARPLTAWLPDPTGRHELRYFDGSRWTEHVANGGAISVDHL